MIDRDLAVRLAAFAWLADKTAALGDVLSRKILYGGFLYEGERIPLMSPQGIFRPRVLDLPLSITTTLQGPYSDGVGPDGLLTYMYRGRDPDHPDNSGLRRAMARSRPLVYFHGIMRGRYLAIWPVYIVGDDRSRLTFKAAVDDVRSVVLEAQAAPPIAEAAVARRRYITATVKIRVHQANFRERVPDAYRSQCSICRLGHRELLDAAHIVPDSSPEGEPLVPNGLSLCKLHHAAFDSFILGVSPDYVVHVRPDVLEEADGPMLVHGLKGLQGGPLALPELHAQWPDRHALEQRFALFRRAA